MSSLFTFATLERAQPEIRRFLVVVVVVLLSSFIHVASAWYSFMCADNCSYYCQLCANYFDETHGMSRPHRYRVACNIPSSEWYPVPPEAMGITDATGAADDDGGGGREVPPHELHLTEAELQELIEFDDEPPWCVLDQFRNPYCMACGNYITDGHLRTDRHKLRIAWKPEDWLYSLEPEDRLKSEPATASTSTHVVTESDASPPPHPRPAIRCLPVRRLAGTKRSRGE